MLAGPAQRAQPMTALLLLLPLAANHAARGSVAPSPVPCLSGHQSCPFTFGMNQSGCCALDDTDAVCCETPLPVGLKRSYCCPKGSSCSTQGCTPLHHSYSCGPSQGTNCSVSFLCSSGPKDWSSTSNGEPAVVVIGDSVSIGWTPVLSDLLNTSHVVTHSPGELADGGARSTTNFITCSDYLLRTAELQPLPLKKGDTVLMNFGLHDYNLGLVGVTEYTEELTQGIKRTQAVLPAGAKLVFVGTTPAHNTATPADDITVVALNKAAAQVCKEFGIAFIDLHSPLIKTCGAVPWADNGTSACSLCAPDCKRLAVHYTRAGYEVIAHTVAEAAGLL